MSKTPTLDQIAAKGNRGESFQPTGPNIIRCADGFQLSVIAGRGSYCTPRPDWPWEGGVERSYPGPYEEVEVGFPSERPEPWDRWSNRAEDEAQPTETVYSYVPVEMVRDLLVAHGGEDAS